MSKGPTPDAAMALEGVRRLLDYALFRDSGLVENADEAKQSPVVTAAKHAIAFLEALGQHSEGDALGYARRLAEAIHEKHYPENTDWKPLPDLLGILTQIDNATSGLVRTPSDRCRELEEALTMAREYVANVVEAEGFKMNRDDLARIDALLTKQEGSSHGQG